jgi:hypothetical protein
MIGVLVIICLAFFIPAGISIITPEFQTSFDIEVNESKTFAYSVDRLQPMAFLMLPSDPNEWEEWKTIRYGYIVAATKTEGKYNIAITTDSPDDTVYMRWLEAHDYLVVDDKFGKTHWQPSVSWVGGRKESCVIDKHSDCNIDMSLRYGLTNPHIDVYIAGKGSGNITIRRLE